jgi:DNA repair protein RecN (Recombination protein N)
LLRRLRIENLVLIREAELELAPGLNAVTGETGAGKTIFAQAIGLLLGARGDAAAVGPAGEEAFVEAELDVPEGFFDEQELAGLAELRPEGEDSLVLARRVFRDGRTRGYAWGRSVSREDLAAAAERLIAMSGQFEQRRLARPSYQLEVLDRFCGDGQLERRRAAGAAWRALAAARRRRDELARDAGAARERLAELEALVADTDGMEAGEEAALRAERELYRNIAELGRAAAAAVQALAPEEGDGAASLAGGAERELSSVAAVAPDLARAAESLRELSLGLQEVGSDLRRFLASLEADPARLEAVEERLDAIAAARRRYGCADEDELLARREAALAELAGLGSGRDPLAAAEAELAEAAGRVDALHAELAAARTEAAPRLEEAVTAELRQIGMGEGTLRVELDPGEPGPSGRDDAVFLIRPNPGLPAAPVAQTASGGELSRIALALAAVAGGETLVFDEIDAGIGGETAHRVALTLQRLADRAQVITITHLAQIARVADAHFRVEKIPGDPTHTRLQRLGDAERREELERMAGGRAFIAALAGDGPS